MSTKHISYKAVLIGFLVDVIGTTVLGLLLGFGLVIYEVSKGTDMEHLDFESSVPLLIAGIALGTTMTFFGGFIAALIAPRAKIFNGTLVGATGIVLGLLFILSQPLWCSLIGMTLAIPAAALGGLIGEMIRPEKPAAPETTPA